MQNKFKHLIITGILTLSVGFTGGWHNGGHEQVTIAAGGVCKNILPDFFTTGIAQAANCAVDPDIFKEKQPDVALQNAEYPEHFFDLELFTDKELPLDRYAFAEWCFNHQLKPGKVGTLPWSITEYTQKLTIAFAEYRKWPENKNIQSKCLVYAGLLAHYCGDAGMPLHSTIHYDGVISDAGDKKRMKGIHLKLDALIEKIPAEQLPAASIIEPVEVTDKILPVVFEFIKDSNKLIDQTYSLYQRIPELDNMNIDDDGVMTYAIEMHKRSVSLLAGLYIHAWQSSADITIPQWHKHKY